MASSGGASRPHGVNGNGAAAAPAGTIEPESAADVFHRLADRPVDLLRFATER